MIMAMVKSACILLVKQMKNPEEIIREINAMIYEQTSADIFVTFVCIALSADRKKIIAINAGHEAPLLRTSKGEVIPLRKGCMVLGVMNDLPHIETNISSIHPGDILCMYTDGLFDSSMQEELTLHEILSKNQFISAHEFMVYIEKRIPNQNGKYASDDKTLLLISIT
jgi:sigma-B regulation protein RsbU (phosphoserine phosphatase)